jgi:hypothetical protein
VDIRPAARADDAHVQGFFKGDPFDDSGASVMRTCREVMVY